MRTTKKSRRITVALAVAAVVTGVFVIWTNWERLQFFLLFESLGLNEQGYREYRHRQTGIVLVLLRGGSFWMGSPRTEPGRLKHEGPVHEVRLSPFLLAKYELTQEQWRKVMGTRPAKFSGDALPVESLLWEDCREFCARTGLSAPTEAQWEYACRAGTQTVYSAGDTEADLSRVGWYVGNSGRRAHPVGELPPNDFGLHDMHGNALEWCSDFFDDDFYSSPEAARMNPVSESESGLRTMRGGCWTFGSENCRSAWRYAGFKFDQQRRTYFGFRPAASAP